MADDEVDDWLAELVNCGVDVVEGKAVAIVFNDAVDGVFVSMCDVEFVGFAVAVAEFVSDFDAVNRCEVFSCDSCFEGDFVVCWIVDVDVDFGNCDFEVVSFELSFHFVFAFRRCDVNSIISSLVFHSAQRGRRIAATTACLLDPGDYLDRVSDLVTRVALGPDFS